MQSKRVFSGAKVDIIIYMTNNNFNFRIWQELTGLQMVLPLQITIFDQKELGNG